MGPGRGAELPPPGREIRGRARRQVVGEGAHPELDAREPPPRLLHLGGERGVGSGVVPAHGHEHPPVQEERPELRRRLPEEGRELAPIPGLGHPPADGVAEREVLDGHRAPVGGLPSERRAVDPPGDAAPDDGPVDPEPPEDLRHLPDVPELVREVPDLQGPSQLAGAGQPALQVPPEGLPRDQELVGLGDPGPNGDPPERGEPADGGLALRADLEVVVDHRGLPVEVEVGEASLGEVEEAVHHRDQALPEDLERLVPLPVPVGVGHERDLPRGGLAPAIGPGRRPRHPPTRPPLSPPRGAASGPAPAPSPARSGAPCPGAGPSPPPPG